MKRLRETDASKSPLLRQAHALLDSVEPLADSDARMHRVRRALDQPQRGGVLQRMPALVMAGVVALFGASAFAAVRYIAARSALDDTQSMPSASAPVRHRHEREQSAKMAAEAPAEAVAVAPSRAGGREVASATTSVSGVPNTVANQAAVPNAHANGEAIAAQVAEPRAEAAAAPAKAPTAVPAGRANRRSRTRHAAATVKITDNDTIDSNEAPSAEDSELVHRAVQALRREGDPALAARLLAEHRARSPRGPLAEEALSLQIEAASALRDGRAVDFARAYLARYPHGRYAQVARKALAETSP